MTHGVALCERTVTNLLEHNDELLAVSLVLDGLQPDVGHEVLRVLRDCLSGAVLLAKSLLSARQADQAALLGTVRDELPVPIAGVVSDGQHSVRKAVAQALPDVPHQLCHFH